jgi:hypothetical protein
MKNRQYSEAGSVIGTLCLTTTKYSVTQGLRYFVP